MAPKRTPASLAILAAAGILGLWSGCSTTPRPPASPVLVPPGPVPPSYPGYVPGASDTPPARAASPPPGVQGYVTPPCGVPPAGYPSPASPQSPAGSPGPGLVPVGATGVATVDRDVIPAGVTGLPPSAPAVPGSLAGSPAEPVAAVAVRAGDKPKEDTGFEWSDLAPDHVWKDIKAGFGYGPDEKLARAAFQEGEALFRQKQFDEAAKRFYTASWRWPDSTLEEDSLFLMGECYFFADHYSSAHDAYANVVKKHENTRYLDTIVSREFDIGHYWEQMDEHSHHWPVTPNLTEKTTPWFDTRGNALGAYDFVRLHDPTGPLADASVMSIANNHFREHEWEEAAYNYDLLRKDYPKSPYQKDAHLLGLQAKLLTYQGPLYDHAPLDDAKEIADQTLTQFRGRLGGEESHVAETRARIIEERAQREWMMAKYYDNKKYYRAARHYYNNILQKYSQTVFAEQARLRLQQIQNEPDTPPNHCAWLTRLFERDR